MSSTEELSDVYAHFTLYYGKDLVAMRNRQAAGKAALEELDMDTSLDGSQVGTYKISVFFVCKITLNNFVTSGIVDPSLVILCTVHVHPYCMYM